MENKNYLHPNSIGVFFCLGLFGFGFFNSFCHSLVYPAVSLFALLAPNAGPSGVSFLDLNKSFACLCSVDRISDFAFCITCGVEW